MTNRAEMKLSNISPYLTPSGCLEEYLLKPSFLSKTIQLAAFHEHRFAFYYWLKWTNKLKGSVPSIVTFDWHQDLCPPYKDKIAGLKDLDTDNIGEVAYYSWAELEHTNDVQIYSAALLNKIKNVYVICRQDTSRGKNMTIKDFKGNKHHVYIFHSIEEFEAKAGAFDEDEIYLDIDLDYFTLANPPSMSGLIKGKNYTYLKKKEIENLFCASRPAMKWILNRLQGFTIAMEPDFCGGLKKSNQLFHILENIFFTAPLFNKDLNSKKELRWKFFESEY